jgi:hypothetical protein
MAIKISIMLFYKFLRISLIVLHPFFSSKVIAQRLIFSDVKSFLSEGTDVGAEKLISKGFEEVCASQGGTLKCFIYTKKNTSLSLEVHDKNNFNANYYLRICYGKTFQQDFQSMKSRILKSGKKLRFFFSSDYRLYFTEYYCDGMYFYLTKGICIDNIDNYKNESLLCSNNSLKEFLI